MHKSKNKYQRAKPFLDHFFLKSAFLMMSFLVLLILVTMTKASVISKIAHYFWPVSKQSLRLENTKKRFNLQACIEFKQQQIVLCLGVQDNEKNEGLTHFGVACANSCHSQFTFCKKFWARAIVSFHSFASFVKVVFTLSQLQTSILKRVKVLTNDQATQKQALISKLLKMASNRPTKPTGNGHHFSTPLTP